MLTKGLKGISRVFSKNFFLVLTTTPSKQEAHRLADALVRSRQAACVNVVARVDSRYWWKGKVETSQESLLLIKTNAQRLRPLCRRLKQMHSYEVPEILVLPISGGSPAYLRWLEGCLKDSKNS